MCRPWPYHRRVEMPCWRGWRARPLYSAFAEFAPQWTMEALGTGRMNLKWWPTLVLNGFM